MRRVVTALAALAVSLVVLTGYQAWWQANRDAPQLIEEAALLISGGNGPNDLGAGRLETFLAVKDPSFLEHNGVDVMHPRPFRRTLTQTLAHESLSWRAPGLGVLQEVFYAFALDQRVPKTAQIALYLDRVHMGTDADGEIVTGFFKASGLIFDQPPHALGETDFLTLLTATLEPLPLHETLADRAPPEFHQRRQQLLAFLEGDCVLQRPSQGLPETCR